MRTLFCVCLVFLIHVIPLKAIPWRIQNRLFIGKPEDAKWPAVTNETFTGVVNVAAETDPNYPNEAYDNGTLSFYYAKSALRNTEVPFMSLVSSVNSLNDVLLYLSGDVLVFGSNDLGRSAVVVSLLLFNKKPQDYDNIEDALDKVITLIKEPVRVDEGLKNVMINVGMYRILNATLFHPSPPFDEHPEHAVNAWLTVFLVIFAVAFFLSLAYIVYTGFKKPKLGGQNRALLQ